MFAAGMETASAAVSVHGLCRYAAGDKVESWLLELLCLNAAEHVPKLPARLPHPTECELYYINRDTLFSYHKVPAPTDQQVCTALHGICACLHGWLNGMSHLLGPTMHLSSVHQQTSRGCGPVMEQFAMGY